jgi:shikimate dehydrogenase
MALKTGLIGKPGAKSLLPIIHKAAYQALELDWDYSFYPCADIEEFDALITLAKKDTADYLGFNVIASWENEAFRTCNTRDNAVSISQCADVLTFGRRGISGIHSLHGDTTQGSGLVRWATGIGLELADSVVAISGVGAATFSILHALIDAKVRAVNVLSSDPRKDQESLSALLRRFAMERHRNLLNKTGVGSVSQMLTSAQALLEQGQKFPPLPPAAAFTYDAASEALVQATVLIDVAAIERNVNAASVVPAQALHGDLVVVDLTCDFEQTPLIKTARNLGLGAYDGLGILIEQAAQTIEIWLKAEGLGKLQVPREVMRESVSQ